jgi:hypothetical protein
MHLVALLPSATYRPRPQRLHATVLAAALAVALVVGLAPPADASTTPTLSVKHYEDRNLVPGLIVLDGAYLEGEIPSPERKAVYRVRLYQGDAPSGVAGSTEDNFLDQGICGSVRAVLFFNELTTEGDNGDWHIRAAFYTGRNAEAACEDGDTPHGYGPTASLTVEGCPDACVEAGVPVPAPITDPEPTPRGNGKRK